MTDIYNSVDKLTHSDEWVIGRTVTVKELQKIIVNVLDFYCWATFGHYIGFWAKTMVEQPDGLWKPQFNWDIGHLERLKCIKRSVDFKGNNETFVIIGRKEYVSPSMSREIIAGLDKQIAELDKEIADKKG